MASPSPAPGARPGSRPPRERLTSIKNSPRARRQPRRQAPKAVQCPSCQSTATEEYNGNTVCSDCGTTINESNIVSEVTFGETAAGAAVVQGAYIGADQRHAKGDGGRFGRGYGTREPREVSELNGKEEMRKQANWHHLPEHIFDQAFSIYKLALNNNFIQGRHISIVAAVCLYAACRRDRNSQMLLIDFAEGVAVNVFRLGQTWSELKKSLYLEDLHHRPVMEVEDLIARFVKKLEFGRDMKKVGNDALLILRRMKRDWMVTGRLPNGLIGACIILAARMNNYRRTVREVVYVVKVADITVAKRLEEFKRTPAASMSIDEFKQNGLRLKQGMPPVLLQRAERERKRKLQAMLNSGNLDEELGQASEEPQSQDLDPKRAPTLGELIQTRESRKDSEGFAIPDLPLGPRPRTTTSASSDPRSSQTTPAADGSTTEGSPTKKPRGRPRKSREPQGPPPQYTDEDLISEAQLEQEMEVILGDTEAFMRADEEIVTVSEAGEARSKALAESLRAGAQRPKVQVSDDRIISEEEFQDDPEVANCLLTDEETKIKERIWVTHNEDWLRTQQAKMLKKALAEAQGTDEKKDKGKKRKKRRRLGDGSLLEGTEVSSAADAARIMLEKHAHGPSKHINYKNVEALYKEFRGPGSSEGGTTRAGSVVAPGSAAQTPAPDPAEERIAGGIATTPAQTRPTETTSGLPTPGPTQATQKATAAQKEGDSGKEVERNANAEKDATAGAEGAEEEDIEDDEDEEDEAAEVWHSDDEDADVDVVGTARDAGIDMGDMEEDENAGWSEHEDDD